MSDLLWQPIGAVDEAYITVDVAGAPRCAGGLCATARDFARIGHLVALGGGGDKADALQANRIDYQALPLTHRAVAEFRRLIEDAL
jgi:CubicO group peptidase (beta-lactamase class C family)